MQLMQLTTNTWRAALAGCALFLALCGTSIAQPAIPPASQPATQPVQRPRHVMKIPPGFHKVEAGFRVVLCEPADDAWVKAAINDTPPTTMPTTMPADVIDQLKNRRQILKARIAGDLSLPDTKLVDDLIDKTMIPQASKLNDVQPPIFYLVATRERIRDLLKAGWTDPNFHYNRVSDDVHFTPDLRLSDDRPMDDMVMPVLYKPEQSPAERQKSLAAVMQSNEAAVVTAFSRRCQLVAQLAIIDFIQKQAIEPLKLKDDQQWLGLGMQAVLSAKYLRDLLGVSEHELLDRMTRDNTSNPIRPEAVDLLKPANRDDMRPEWVPLYGDSFRVKSARVVRAWSDRCGESAIATTLAAMRKNPPADGPALLKLIQVTTGVDLTNDVRAR